MKTYGSISDRNSNKNETLKQAPDLFLFYVRAFMVVLLQGDLQSGPDSYGEIMLYPVMSYCRGAWNSNLFLQSSTMNRIPSITEGILFPGVITTSGFAVITAY